MKKCMRIFTLLLMAALAVVSLAACGGSQDQESSSEETASLVSGKTYTFTSCTADGEDMTDSITAIYSEQSFMFEDDGTCTQTIVWAEELAETMGSDPVVQDGTYTENGSVVTVTFPSDEEELVMEFTVDGDTLTMDDEGSVMTYTAN